MILYSIAADFSRARVRLAVFLTLLETLRIGFAVLAVATLLLALVLLGAPYVAHPAWMSCVAIGVAWNVFCLIVIFALSYYLNLREVRRALRILPTTRVNYQLSDDGCAISSDAWSEFLPWRSFVRLTRYPRMVLLEIVEHRSKKELTESLRVSLRARPERATILRQGRGFPVFWMLPLPLRTFLIIPAGAVPEEQIAFIRDRLGTAGRA